MTAPTARHGAKGDVFDAVAHAGLAGRCQNVVQWKKPRCPMQVVDVGIRL